MDQIRVSDYKNNEISFDDSSDNYREIKVALYTDEIENELFYSPYRRTCYFVYALRDYTWKVNNKTYIFKVDLLSSKDLFRGKLIFNQYDMILFPPDQSRERNKREHIFEKINIELFIKLGGGYFGTCAGSTVSGDMINKPDTNLERGWKKRMLGISDVKECLNRAIPLYCQFIGRSPTSIGPCYAYYSYSGWNQTNDTINYYPGVCLDCPIKKNNPIFDDYHENTRRIRWIGGEGLIIPENTQREITVLASYPELEISDNISTRIHYWKYVGGVKGLISSIFQKGTLYYGFFSGLMQQMYIYASDWERTDSIVQTNLSNMPIMTSEIYPNRNQGRIVRCSGHPEHNVWWGGYIQEVKDTDDNNQYEALYFWKDIKDEKSTIEDEFSYNYWIIRRSVAWVSKVPDNHLPPIYGPSQVCDIYPYMQSNKVNLLGISELANNGITSLELYYRFSNDNDSWSNWTFYDVDKDESDGWSWEFDAEITRGTGYYQFYSIRRVDNQGYYESERAPPGSDCEVYINVD
ncbi:MAG: hypothetical protein MUO82_07885 [Candidatus Thermoplasmatota archaeon]|nr:hypothetical protein [Candidatus Thermoplasmatota archaeon]